MFKARDGSDPESVKAALSKKGMMLGHVTKIRELLTRLEEGLRPRRVDGFDGLDPDDVDVICDQIRKETNGMFDMATSERRLIELSYRG